MGAWSASLNSWFKYEIPPNRDIDIELPITGSRAHSVIFQPPEQILADNPISAHALFAKAIIKGSAKELELYPRSNGHLYVCGEGDGVALPYSADLIKPNLTSTKNLIRFAQTLVPILSEYEIIREQACYLPYSETGSPIIGHLPFFENLLVATGHSCWGMLNAPATGLSIAQLILTGRSSIVDLTPFGLE
ncbi:hypothetical protein DSO57_1005503 [Entomophthora muscae]|nr:hypothetical protein DSO57_1005503 [Entomophthora muscae]